MTWYRFSKSPKPGGSFFIHRPTVIPKPAAHHGHQIIIKCTDTWYLPPGILNQMVGVRLGNWYFAIVVRMISRFRQDWESLQSNYSKGFPCFCELCFLFAGIDVQPKEDHRPFYSVHWSCFWSSRNKSEVT